MLERTASMYGEWLSDSVSHHAISRLSSVQTNRSHDNSSLVVIASTGWTQDKAKKPKISPSISSGSPYERNKLCAKERRGLQQVRCANVEGAPVVKVMVGEYSLLLI